MFCQIKKSMYHLAPYSEQLRTPCPKRGSDICILLTLTLGVFLGLSLYPFEFTLKLCVLRKRKMCLVKSKESMYQLVPYDTWRLSRVGGGSAGLGRQEYGT